MATSNIEITGLSDLYAQLQQLSGKIESNVMRGALRAGLQVVRTAAINNVPVQDGDLRDSIRISARRRSMKYGWVRMHLVAGNDVAYYANMVEFGTAQHIIRAKERPTRKTRRGTVKGLSIKTMNKMLNSGSLKIGGRYVGASVLHPGARPAPFMRPAIDGSQQQALEAMRDYIAKRLPREIKKAGKA